MKKRRFFSTFFLLIGFHFISFFFFFVSKGYYEPRHDWIQSIARLSYHTPLIVPFFIVCAVILVTSISIRPFYTHSILSKAGWAQTGFVLFLFILSFVPLGNWIKHHSFFFENWMWYCLFWILGLALTITFCSFVVLFYPRVFEWAGRCFNRITQFFFYPQYNPWDKVFISCVSLTVFLISTGISLSVMGGIPHVQDSVAQLFQAKIFSHGRLAFPAPEDPKFFERIYVVVMDGRWYTIYPPGHAIVLALGVLAGAPYLVNPFIAALFIPLFYYFVRTCFYGVYGARLCAVPGRCLPSIFSWHRDL